ncbi:MAG: hypothetical protein KKH67_04040 [candidate division Zixibacteria bacterium]|nr:hypothetical protein [candidate division Zixibacteria bacterium]MBU1469750.1 hypothetical protein [candidate division Zixibacteria bacterium]
MFPVCINEDNSDRISPSENHIFSWGDDCLYMITGDLGDTVRFAPKPYEYIPLEPVVSRDLSHYIVGGTMCRIVDSTYIVLDTMISDIKGDSLQCDFLYYSFIPTEPAVIFILVCDDDETFVLESIGSFNYETGELTIIDSIAGMEDFSIPVYSPDGEKIALLSDGKVYILYRWMNEVQ